MPLTSKLASLASVLSLALGAANAQETPATTPTETQTVPVAATAADRGLFANPFDPSTWYDGTEGMDPSEMAATETMNLAHPSFWLAFVSPDTHTKRHMQFTNPATYAQFMDPGFYMNFANPTNWLAWLNPKNYETLVKAETYTYWMQPGAYMHGTRPDGYMQAFDLKNYKPYVTPATYFKWADPAEYQMTETAAGMEETMDMMNPVNVFSYVTGVLSPGS